MCPHSKRLAFKGTQRKGGAMITSGGPQKKRFGLLCAKLHRSDEYNMFIKIIKKLLPNQIVTL